MEMKEEPIEPCNRAGDSKGEEATEDKTVALAEEAATTGYVLCPLCNQPISCSDNDALNRHIDTCLNASTVRQAVREATTATMSVSNKKRRLSDFWQKP